MKLLDVPMALLVFDFNYKQFQPISPTSIFRVIINKNDNYAIRLIYCSPFTKNYEYFDPVDFQLKTGPARRCRMLAWLKIDNKRMIRYATTVLPY